MLDLLKGVRRVGGDAREGYEQARIAEQQLVDLGVAHVAVTGVAGVPPVQYAFGDPGGLHFVDQHVHGGVLHRRDGETFKPGGAHLAGIVGHGLPVPDDAEVHEAFVRRADTEIDDHDVVLLRW